MIRIPLTSLCAAAALMTVASFGGCKPAEYDFSDEDNDAAFPNPPPEVNPVQTDRVVQVAQPKVDVLFVVDNSCSMSEEQAALADNFPEFINYFLVSGIDFHLGVTSTDTYNNGPGTKGKLRAASGTRFIDADTANPGAVFQQMTNMGTGGHYDEAGRDAAYKTLELNREIAANVDFYREDASMHIVFVTDEEDLSTNNPVSRAEFIEWMHNLKFSTDMTVAHGIYYIPGTPCDTAYPPAGTAYNAYVNQTNGSKQSICTEDWGPFLDELGLQTSGLRREFFLTRIPVTNPWTIDVRVVTGSTEFGFVTCDGALEIPTECEVVYNAARNSVTFLYEVPDPFSEVLVTYNVQEQFSAE